MTNPGDVLERYRELCAYCEVLAQRVQGQFGVLWQCQPGCSGCCRLESVCGLEAVVLLQAGLPSHGLDLAEGDVQSCCLLRDDRCLLYEARPIICRTHGLPLVSSSLTADEVDCCPLNLPALAGVGELSRGLILDLDQVTENLMRLNLAFFLVLGRPELAEARFTLAALCSGRDLPAELLAATGIPGSGLIEQES